MRGNVPDWLLIAACAVCRRAVAAALARARGTSGAGATALLLGAAGRANGRGKHADAAALYQEVCRGRCEPR